MKFNIGILFPVSRKMGVFQYATSITEGLINYCPDFDYTILYFKEESPKEFLKANNKGNTKYISLDASPNNLLGKLKFFSNCILGRAIFTVNKKNREILKKAAIDLLIVPFPLLFGFENNIPYIVSVPDVMWNYYPDFPEYPFFKRLKNDFVVRYCTKYSLMNIVDAQSGADDLNKFYKIPYEKIKTIPYIPPGYIYELKDMSFDQSENILRQYNLPQKFLFYPAQFWFHKNHIRLIKALKILKDQNNIKVNLVLVGDPGANNKNYQTMMSLVKEANMQDQIFHLGYVSDQEVAALYKKSYALVFPTLIGPTSIPPLEAMVLGTPVLCSNLFSMPEQIGSAGLFFNPFDEKDIAQKIYKIWLDENMRNKMIDLGRQKARSVSLENYATMWIGAVKEALSK